MTTPTRDALANDLGERCQIIIGKFGYLFSNGKDISIKPQKSRSENAVFISTAEYLNMRDYDYFSRIVVNDWRKGSGQIVFVADDPNSKPRFFDSTAVDVSRQGAISMAKDITANVNGTDSNSGIDSLPLIVAGGYLYMGTQGSVKFSTDWAAAPSSASAVDNFQQTGFCTDGQNVYSCSQGRGIIYWPIGSTAAASTLNTNFTTPRALIFANRRIYALTFTGSPPVSTLYEVTIPAGIGTSDFIPPTGWTLTDLVAGGGGAIDSPIYVLGIGGAGSKLWYWDGTAIHDYIDLPTGFVGARLHYYQGILYVLGASRNPTGTYSPCVYYVANNTLGFLGYLGQPQSNGDPTPDYATGVTRANFWADATGTLMYFAVGYPATQEIWRYDIVNGGLSRYFSITNGNRLESMVLFNGAPWLTLITVGLFSSRTTFVSSATLVTSDMHLGQLWASNLWVLIETIFGILRAGEAVLVEYSVDQGVTWTSAGSFSFGTDGAISRKPFLISTAAGVSVKGAYIRLRFTFTAGTSQLTSPTLNSFALKATPMDPAGPLIDCWVACPDLGAMPNAGPDWQGASGAERLQNIIDLFESQSIAKVIYMAPGSTRAKNPKTIDARIVDYDWKPPSSVGYGPNRGVEGDIRVILRQVI